MAKFEIDAETADRITYLNLREYQTYLQSELDQWRANPRTDANPDGFWLHPDDVVDHIRVIDSIEVVCKQYEPFHA
jgi:hypothetical protein